MAAAAEQAPTGQSAALRQIAVDAPAYRGYRPLDPERREIRVLDLKSNLNCWLRHVSLDDNPPYFALSYYWGFPSATKPITVIATDSWHHEIVQLRKTLYRFLKSLLRQYGAMTVWLDVICINQRSFDEQSAQVAMMGDIYRQAACVYAWMGNDDADIEYTLRYANLPASMKHSSGFELDNVLSGATQLSMRRYWTRMWTIQECVVNKNLIIVCGSTACSWQALEHVVVETSNSMPNYTAPQFLEISVADRPPTDKQVYFENLPIMHATELSPLQRMMQVRGIFTSRQEPLVDLLLRFRDAECSDKHDQVYGLLALAMDSDRLTVDYATGLFELVVQTLSNDWKTQLHLLYRAEIDAELRGDIVDDMYEEDQVVMPNIFSRPPRKMPPRPKQMVDRAYQLCCIITMSEKEVLEGLHDSSTDFLATPVVPLTFQEMDRHAHLVSLGQKAASNGRSPEFARLATIWGPVPGHTAPDRHRYQICDYKPYHPAFGEWGWLGGSYVDIDSLTGKVVNFMFGCHLSHEKTLSEVALMAEDSSWPSDDESVPFPRKHPRSQDLSDMDWEIKKLEDFQTLWQGHMWICEATSAVHISRCFLALLINMSDPRWASCRPPSFLVAFGQWHRVPVAERQCHCAAVHPHSPDAKPWWRPPKRKPRPPPQPSPPKNPFSYRHAATKEHVQGMMRKHY